MKRVTTNSNEMANTNTNLVPYPSQCSYQHTPPTSYVYYSSIAHLGFIEVNADHAASVLNFISK